MLVKSSLRKKEQKFVFILNLFNKNKTMTWHGLKLQIKRFHDV